MLSTVSSVKGGKYMGFLKKDISRRQFIGGALALAAASAVPSFIRGAYKPTQSDSLQVWTCGGLSEAFLDLNQVYTMHTGHNIQYTEIGRAHV